MSQPASRWDLCRFLRTLTYFGAIPGWGQMAWLQRLLGHDTGSTIAPSAIAPDPPPSSQDQTAPSILTMGWDKILWPELIQALTGEGLQVRSLVPHGSQARAALGEGAKAIEFVESADGVTPHSLRDACQGIQAVVWLPAPEALMTMLADGTIGAIAETIHSVPAAAIATHPIVDFRTLPEPIDQIWGPIDDVVMGGVSESKIVRDGAIAQFSGTVSTANSGGFASVRTRNFDPPLNLTGYDGIELRIKGDGQRYKFLVRDEIRWDGVAHSFSFDTVADQWMTIRIPFSETLPVFRAKTQDPSQGVNTSSIYALQFMLSKFEYDGALNPQFAPGPFQLQIERITAYRQAVSPRLIVLTDTNSEAVRAIATALNAAHVPHRVIQHPQVSRTAPRRLLSLQPHPAHPPSQPQDPVHPQDLAGLCVKRLSDPHLDGEIWTVSG